MRPEPKEGQKVKLLEAIKVGPDTYEIGNSCLIICITDDTSTENEVRYFLNGDVFDENTQEYNPPFIVTKAQI